MADGSPQDQPVQQVHGQPEQLAFPFAGITNVVPEEPVNNQTATPAKDQPASEGESAEVSTPIMNSQFFPPDPVKVVQNFMKIPQMDPHLQEMLKSAKLRNINGKLRHGLEVDFGEGSLFVGTFKSQDVISIGRGKLDERGADIMVSLAKEKGWNTVFVTPGTSKREKEMLWIAAQRQGLHVGNFSPKPGSEILAQWQEEQKHSAASGITPVAEPGDNFHVKTMQLLQEKCKETDDPAVQAGLKKILNIYTEGHRLGDERTYNALSDALSDKTDPRDGFNKVVDILNTADPSLHIPERLGEEAPAARISRPAIKSNRATP